MTTLTGSNPERLDRPRHREYIRRGIRLTLAALLVGAASLFVLIGALPDEASTWLATIAATLIGLGVIVFGVPLRLSSVLMHVKVVDLTVFAMLALLASIIRIGSGATWPAWVIAGVLLVRVAGAITRRVMEWRRG